MASVAPKTSRPGHVHSQFRLDNPCSAAISMIVILARALELERLAKWLGLAEEAVQGYHGVLGGL